MADAFIVILKKGVCEEDVISRIKQIEGVLNVKPADTDTIITVTRLWEKIDQVFEDELKERGE